MSLYWRLFLWFLAANVLTVAVTFVVAAPLLKSMENVYKPETEAYQAVEIFERDGEKGLRDFIQARHPKDERGRTPYCMLVDVKGEPVINDRMPRPMKRNIMELVMETNEIKLRHGGKLHSMAVQGQQQSYFWVSMTPPPSPENNKKVVMFARLVSGVLVVIFVAWLAARWLTGPINQLRSASLELASGDLDTRVDSSVSSRRDELGELARDFDNMAQQINALISSNQRLIRDISHELRTPLARLHVALELARDTNNPAYLDRIAKDAQQIDAMLGDILTLSRLDLGESDSFEKLSLDKLLYGLIDDARFEAQGKNIAVECIAAPNVIILGNAALLSSAIENVIRNAIRYAPENGHILVSLTSSKNNAVITITDNGAGVPDDELDNIFRPFHRVGSSRDRQSGGHGVGLAICAAAVANHSGSVNASNHAKGGLQVTITLPIAS
jgi:signal transduction histidine kinase